MSSVKACKRKQGYSKKEAEELCALRNAKNGRGGLTYKCPNCGWWHLAKYKNPEQYKEDREFSVQFRAKLGLPPRRNP